MQDESVKIVKKIETKRKLHNEELHN